MARVRIRSRRSHLRRCQNVGRCESLEGLAFTLAGAVNLHHGCYAVAGAVLLKHVFDMGTLCGDRVRRVRGMLVKLRFLM